MEKLLEVEKIRKEYKGFVLNDISFTLEPGTITGFIGENGAGKTTTLYAVMKLIRLDGGRILFKGTDIRSLPVLKDISFLESECIRYPNVSMGDYVSIVKSIFAKSWQEDAFQSYLQAFDLRVTKQKIKVLSTGLKTKFFLAVELAKTQKLLLLDEPTAGLDPLVRNDVLAVIRKLVAQNGTTVMFSSHITSDVEAISDRVLFLHKGELLLDMSRKQLGEKYMGQSLESVMLKLSGRQHA